MSNPLRYAVHLKDNNGVLIGDISNKIDQLSWEWNRLGGCGKCTAMLREEWDGALAGSFAEDYELNIFAPQDAGTSALWYSGYVDKAKPRVSGSEEFLSVNFLGYVNQLKRVILKDTFFVGIEMADAAQSIIETNAVPITKITSADADYEETQFSADRLDFNEDALSAIKTLAGIAGNREWGVRADKSFFFLARDEMETKQYNITEDFVNFSPLRDFNPIITRIYLEGGKGYSGRFTVTNRITTREQIISNSSVTTQSVGQQFARTYLKEKGKVHRSYQATLIAKDTRIEKTIPMGKASVNIKRGIRDKYDVVTNLYDSGIKYDGGTESFQIDKIRYVLKDDNIDTTIFFGPVPEDLADDLNRLEFQIQNERNK